jgi:serine/threonine protein kinase
MRQCPICAALFDGSIALCPSDGAPLAPEDPHLGRVLGGSYVIEALIGSGGMGAVYSAKQLSLDRPVAVKILRSRTGPSAAVAERFKREALAIARLRHPHIVVVHDFVSESEVGAYIVLELLVGRSLRAEIAKRGRQSPDVAVAVLDQICRGVQAAHESGIIHRDLKPENVFLARGPGQETAKVLDFGVARLMSGLDANEAMLTQTGAFLGTPVYASPEHCRAEELDERSDVYSLGCMAYEMLTGAPPFVARNVMALLRKHVTEQPIPPSELVPAIPIGIERVVMRALAKIPSFRFPSAREFSGALTAGLACANPSGDDEGRSRFSGNARYGDAETISERAAAETIFVGVETPEAAIDRSYDLLDESERAMLGLLSLFDDGCTLEPLEALYEEYAGGETDILDVLSRLVDRTLVFADGDDDEVRYRVLESVRSRAQEWLREAGDEEGLRRAVLAGRAGLGAAGDT